MSDLNFMNSIANPFVKLLARSPLHKLVDKNVVLITYTGRKSGDTHTVPVNYSREGRTLHIISLRERNWWRNMKGGATVKVILEGKEYNGWAELIQDKKAVASELKLICEQDPQHARYLEVSLDEDEKPVMKDLMKAAQARIAVIIKLS